MQRSGSDAGRDKLVRENPYLSNAAHKSTILSFTFFSYYSHRLSNVPKTNVCVKKLLNRVPRSWPITHETLLHPVHRQPRVIPTSSVTSRASEAHIKFTKNSKLMGKPFPSMRSPDPTNANSITPGYQHHCGNSWPFPQLKRKELVFEPHNSPGVAITTQNQNWDVGVLYHPQGDPSCLLRARIEPLDREGRGETRKFRYQQLFRSRSMR